MHACIKIQPPFTPLARHLGRGSHTNSAMRKWAGCDLLTLFERRSECNFEGREEAVEGAPPTRHNPAVIGETYETRECRFDRQHKCPPYIIATLIEVNSPLASMTLSLSARGGSPPA